MGDILTAISNFLSASWRAGAALFLVGASVHLSKVYGIPPLSELDPQWYQGAVLLGVLGLAFLIVHGLVLLAQGISFASPHLYRLMMAPSVRKRQQRLALERAEKDRELSLKNWQTISKDDLECLVWLKDKGWKRFKGWRGNDELKNLYYAHLLEQDISEREKHSKEIHWVVPDVIWEKLKEVNYNKRNLPTDPPWERSDHW